MAKPTPLKPEEAAARAYVDRLILEKLTELREVVKPSEVAEKLQPAGVGLAAVRSLLASNPEKFAYSERRWVPSSRIEGMGRPFSEIVLLTLDRFGGPMPLSLLTLELTGAHGMSPEALETAIPRLVQSDGRFLLTRREELALSAWVFKAHDEPVARAHALNGVDADDVQALAAKLKGFDWRDPDATIKALEKTAPVHVKTLGAVAWSVLSPQDGHSVLLYDWRAFNAELLSIPGFVLSSDGVLSPEADAKKWISTAVKVAEKLAPTVEIEDAAPLELKPEDTEAAIKRILAADGTKTATTILENQFEITPTVKTFPDDLRNVMAALKKDERVWWVGGDRFRKPNDAPDFIYTLPDALQFVKSDQLQEDGDPVDVELTDDGLSSSLRKLIVHPLATDVQDEESIPALKQLPERLRLVLKPIHRELGTFPMSQFPTGWFEDEPAIQELIFVAPDGHELQVWMNNKVRLLFNLFDWWLDQPIESGAVFNLARTHKPNVFEFSWEEQTDPVVYISNQRMEELRELASRADDLSTFDLLREVMTHWPKGADFLTVLWEINVVRRTSRRLLASLLSSYLCFYQRSGSPVWHYDHKKVEQGFDKTKKKFIKKD
ncbi:MAG: hypothetical protein KF857_10285 [Fimbriimonadaceae bacterium]|nr:hypothetical protein [Fimbriimonadaceae bacterium]